MAHAGKKRKKFETNSNLKLIVTEDENFKIDQPFDIIYKFINVCKF